MLPMKSTISFEWRLQGTRIIDKLPPDEKYRTCCNCCHIRTGTLFLGLAELIAVAFLFVNIVKQLMWKHNDRAVCAPGELLKDCLIFNFSHFNVTLAGDYVVALLMISIMLSVCIVLLFYGIATVRPGFLFPHIIVQAFGLICSLTYFFLYAWSYFYGDLHTQRKSFKLEALVERMWLASIVLIFSAFQCYLFLTVIKCTLFLSKLADEQKRRKSQFQEVSDRVKLAKENGLWDTSWGGTFQQYRGENDEAEETKRNHKRKDKHVNRVQWDLQKNEEKSISMCPEDSTSEHCRTKHKTIVELHKEPKKPAIKSANVPVAVGQKAATDVMASKESKEVKAPESPQRQHRHRRPRTATAEDRSPTRLHKTDSTDSARVRRRERDLSGSPTTKKKRTPGVAADAMQTANVAPSSTTTGESSPKAHHRQRREREREHRSREDHHGRVSPTKPMSSATPVVKKVSISSSNPLAFPANGFVS